jgi:protein O-mannosyl-transferase
MSKLGSIARGTRHELLCGILFWIVCVVAWLIFVPAQHGAFIFDDFPNLQGLVRLSYDSGWSAFIRYVQAGFSGPLGRPIALATFAMQHGSWPRHAADFIRTNALLHLLNFCLLWWWLLRWQRLADAKAGGTGLLLGLAISLLWLLAPMQANAVFYVVQRMAVLSGTFILLGLLLHTVGRDPARRDRPLAAYALMTAGVVVGLGLGILAKESAALYPALVLAFELTLLRGVATPVRWRSGASFS